MQTWLGTSKGISLSECRYATLSMNGIRMLGPGGSTAWNLPRRSTTQAFCCGTTLSRRYRKMIAATIRMRARTWNSMAMSLWGRSGAPQREFVVADFGDHVRARHGGTVPDVAHVPRRTAVRHARGAVGVPAVDLHLFADIEIDVGVGGRRRMARVASALAVPGQHRGAADQHGDHHLRE